MKEKQIFHVSKMNKQIRSTRNNSKEVCNNFLLFGLVSPNKNFFIHSLKSKLALKAYSTRLNLLHNFALESGFNRAQRKFWCSPFSMQSVITGQICKLSLSKLFLY